MSFSGKENSSDERTNYIGNGVVKIRNKKIISTVLVISNIVYAALGWVVFILFDLTSPDDPKFDIDQTFRISVFPILFIVCIVGEILILKKFYKNVFNSNLKHFIIYMFFNAIICAFPLLIGLIESFFN